MGWRRARWASQMGWESHFPLTGTVCQDRSAITLPGPAGEAAMK